MRGYLRKADRAVSMSLIKGLPASSVLLTYLLLLDVALIGWYAKTVLESYFQMKNS
jgi:hypothetical protein